MVIRETLENQGFFLLSSLSILAKNCVQKWILSPICPQRPLIQIHFELEFSLSAICLAAISKASSQKHDKNR